LPGFREPLSTILAGTSTPSATAGKEEEMSGLVVETALRRLLRIRPPTGRPPDGEAHHVPGSADRQVVHSLVRSAAALLETLDRVGAGEMVRQRAGLMDRETAPGTQYDESRRSFINLFGPDDDLPIPPPAADFGTLRDGRNGYASFPSCLQAVQRLTGEYTQLVPFLKATRDYQPTPVDLPDFTGATGRRGRGRKKSPGGSAPRAVKARPNPAIVAQAWAAQLHRLELLASRDHFWGCHLILLCHEARDPAQGDLATTHWLYGHLERELAEAVEAIQGAAADVTEEWLGGRRENPETESDVSHADDFRSIVWFGKPYTFTRKQAGCVACLWEAWERRRPGVSKEVLIRACQSDGNDVKDIFKGSPAWRKIIVSPQQGLYCLKPPAKQ
jgi:hypothetical protein